MMPLRTKAVEWINSLYELNLLDEKEKISIDSSFHFKLEGFADEPLVYLCTTIEGLKHRYEATEWGGYMPAPSLGVLKQHSLS